MVFIVENPAGCLDGENTARISVRTAVIDDLPALRRLFGAVFMESSEGLDLFFSRAFQPENTVVAQCADTLCGMFYILPGKLVVPRGTSGAERLPAAYLYALAVDPARRGRGAAGMILRYLKALLPARGFAAAILKPAEPSLYGYYARFGFETAFWSRRAVFHFPGAARPLLSLRPVRLDALPGGRERCFSDCVPLFDWTGDQLSYAADYLALSGWKTVYAQTASGPVYAVYAREGDSLRVLEVGGPERGNTVEALCALENVRRAQTLLPACENTGDPAAQAQALWLDPRAVLPPGLPGYFSLGLD